MKKALVILTPAEDKQSGDKLLDKITHSAEPPEDRNKLGRYLWVLDLPNDEASLFCLLEAAVYCRVGYEVHLLSNETLLFSSQQSASADG